MQIATSVLPDGFPTVIAEYEWFLKNFNTPECFLIIRIIAVGIFVFIGATYVHALSTERKEDKKGC